jgi:hypothetical protein
MRKRYEPPKQSLFGQTFDSVVLLLLVMAALFIPLRLGLAGAGKTAIEFPAKTWEGMQQNPTMIAAWEKLGYTPETAAEIASQRFDYSFSLMALIITAIVVIGYFIIVIHFSRVEYKDVIAERFDKN